MPTTINASNTSGGAIITPDGSGVLELQSGGVTGLTVSGANVTVAGTLAATGGLAALTSPVSVIGNASAGAEIRLPEDTDNGVNYVAIKAPNALAANLTFTLPAADGTNGQFIRTDGAGQLSFATVSPGGTTGQIQFNNAGVFGGVTAVPVANGGTGATTLTGVVKGNGTSAFTTGTVSVSEGGTGATTLTANAVLIGNGTSAVTAVAPGSTGNILTSNGTTWTSAAAPAAGLQGVMVVLTSGTSYTIPAGVTKIKATVVGGGGGLSGSFINSTGGGGGGTAVKYFTVTPGASITYAVGAAGTAGVNGGDSSITVSGTTVTGGGGVAGSSGGTAIFSSGGSATNGDLNITGSGGGGTAGGITFGGSSLFGRGGMANSNANTTPSVGYGAGGTYLNTSVQPTAGVVIIEY